MSHNSVPVYIGVPIRRTYPSIARAAEMLGTSSEHIMRMVRDGHAQRLDQGGASLPGGGQGLACERVSPSAKLVWE